MCINGKKNNISRNGDRKISLYDYLEKLQFINYRRPNQNVHKQLLNSFGIGQDKANDSLNAMQHLDKGRTQYKVQRETKDNLNTIHKGKQRLT